LKTTMSHPLALEIRHCKVPCEKQNHLMQATLR
jgi:hypothetical protein